VGTPPVLRVGFAVEARSDHFDRVPFGIRSPDGTRIAVANLADGQIWTMRADGSAKRAITTTHAENGFSAWAPNDRIVFTSGTQGNHDIYVMDADGSHVTRLTDDPADDTVPDSSPGGRRILFSSTGTP